MAWCHSQPVLALVILLISAAFGAADQYVGSLAAHSWAVEVSLLSAPWLLLPLLAGATRRTPKSAAVLGFAATLAALIGYGLMTLSPLEGAHLNMGTAVAFLRSEALVFIGGAVTGPLFGWLGQRWRTRGAIAGPLITVTAFCLEPLAHEFVPGGIAVSQRVALAEVIMGVAVALAGLLLHRRFIEVTQRLR